MRRYMPYILDGMVLYVGGGFSSAGGVANTGYIAKWSGGVWSAWERGWPVVQPKLSVTCRTIYTGGAFTSGRLIRHTWQNGLGVPGLVSGIQWYVFAIAIGPNGLVYATAHSTMIA